MFTVGSIFHPEVLSPTYYTTIGKNKKKRETRMIKVREAVHCNTPSAIYETTGFILFFLLNVYHFC